MFGFKGQICQFQLPPAILIQVVTLDPSWPPIVLAIVAKRYEKKIRCLCVGACLVTWWTFSFWWHCCGYLPVTVIGFTEWQLCVLTLTVRQRFRMIFPIICRRFCCTLVQLLGVLTLRLSYSRNHDNGQLPPHTPCHFFVSPSPFSTTAQQWVGHPELFISVKWKSSWILNISSEVVANLVFYFFFLFLFFFFLQLKRAANLIAGAFQRLTDCLTSCTYLFSSFFSEGLEKKKWIRFE